MTTPRRLLLLGVCLRATQGLYDKVAKLESTRLYGNIKQFAYYFIDIDVGNPPQRVSVIADTGSQLVAFPCDVCEHCGKHLDKRYRPDLSKTFQWVNCTSEFCFKQWECSGEHCAYKQSYQEGSSINGWYFTDFVRLGLSASLPVESIMGCHRKEEKLFYTQVANGIMGMAPNREGTPTILTVMYDQLKTEIAPNIFSMCVSEWGGMLTVGGYNKSYNMFSGMESPMQWVPMVARGYYSIFLKGLSLKGQELANGNSFGTTILDSGTTYTYFPSAIFTRLKAAILAHCDGGKCGATRVGEKCWTLASAKDGPKEFPTLTFALDGNVTVSWSAWSYLWRKEDDQWCHSFANNGDAGETVLGMSFFMHKNLCFDIAGKRLGIADALCPMETLDQKYTVPEYVDHNRSAWLLKAAIGAAAAALAATAAACCLFRLRFQAITHQSDPAAQHLTDDDSDSQ